MFIRRVDSLTCTNGRQKRPYIRDAVPLGIITDSAPKRPLSGIPARLDTDREPDKTVLRRRFIGQSPILRAIFVQPKVPNVYIVPTEPAAAGETTQYIDRNATRLGSKHEQACKGLGADLTEGELDQLKRETERVDQEICRLLKASKG